MKLPRNKIIRNASWILICRVIQSVFALVISMITARYLGPANYGVVNYGASIAAFLYPISSLGLGNILVQETLGHPEEEGKIYGTSLILSLGASGLCMLGIWSFASWANAGEGETILVCVLYSFVLLAQAAELIRYWFQARFLSKYVSLISLGAYLVVSGYKILLFATGKSIYWFALSNAFDYLLIALGLLVTYRKLGGGKLAFSAHVARRMVRSSRHYIVAGMMVTVFAQTDKIMLKLMVGETATGYYSAAVACAGLTSFVFTAILDSARPAIFEAEKQSREKLESSVSLLYCLVTYLSLAQSAAMAIFAKPLVGILYGAQYTPAVDVLRLVVWYTTFSYLGAVRNIWMLAEGTQKYLWVINLSGAGANILLNALLIPLWGVMGAAAASLVTQFFTNVIVSIMIKPIRRNNLLILRGLDIRQILRLFHGNS